MDNLCEFCGCEPAYNFHHFIPKTTHTNKWFLKNFTPEEMKKGMNVCKQCHSMIHDTIPKEKELGRHYNTLAKLKKHPELSRYIKWKQKRKK